MQALRNQNDEQYWTTSRQYWIEKADMYARWGLKADFLRCMNRVEIAEMNLQEVRGEILCYGPEIYLRA